MQKLLMIKLALGLAMVLGQWLMAPRGTSVPYWLRWIGFDQQKPCPLTSENPPGHQRGQQVHHGRSPNGHGRVTQKSPKVLMDAKQDEAFLRWSRFAGEADTAKPGGAEEGAKGGKRKKSPRTDPPHWLTRKYPLLQCVLLL